MMILLLLATLVATAVANHASYIVGGHEAPAHSHPYIGSLERYNGWTGPGWAHNCGCSLIDAQWCLTAANCLDGASADELRVVLGAHDIQGTPVAGQQTIGVAQVFKHPGYNYTADGFPNNVALLRLSSVATTLGTVAPISLAPAGSDYTGKDTLMAGWGMTADGTMSGVLQEVSIPAISNTECQSKWSDVPRAAILDSHICAFDNQKTDACGGDSGGPMIYRDDNANPRDVLIGVISWGSYTCMGDYPSVSDRVSYFRDWIQNTCNCL